MYWLVLANMLVKGRLSNMVGLNLGEFIVAEQLEIAVVKTWFVVVAVLSRDYAAW